MKSLKNVLTEITPVLHILKNKQTKNKTLCRKYLLQISCEGWTALQYSEVLSMAQGFSGGVIGWAGDWCL